MKSPGVSHPTTPTGSTLDLPMSTTPRLLLSTALPALLLTLSPSLLAQTAPAPSAAAAATAIEDAAAKKKKQQEQEAVLLTVFEVKGDASDTYDATNTNSVTGTNTALNKTPLDAKVFNRQLMDELGVVDMTEMLSRLGGLGPAVINAAEDVRGTLEGDRQDPKSMTMRGLQINNPRRDGFLRSDTTLLDTFDIERVEAIGGSNSLLFGSGDAGGVITSASKRAYINRRPTMTLTALGDSEGSRRYTFDAQAGGKYFAMRVDAVKSDLFNFRPGLRQQAEGLHLATTIQPWKRLQIRGEYRHYTRDTVFAQAVTVAAPTTFLLPATDPLGYPTINSNKTNLQINGSNIRYLVGLPAAQSFLNGVFDVTKVDSATGPYTRDAYVNTIRSVVAEATLAEGLAIQLRYGHDSRVNDALRPSVTNVFAPGTTGNLYVNPDGRVGQDWAFNTSMTATPFWTGARGYRASIAYQKDLGKWFGRHQASLFHQDMDSWTNQQPWRFYEVDASGKTIQNAALINNVESGRNAMPATWIPIFPNQILGGKPWRNYYVQHPNNKTYHYEPRYYTAVTPTKGNPMGLSGPINATTGAITDTQYTMDDTQEVSSGASLFSEWWKGRIDTMAGYRREEASGIRNHTGIERPANSYDSVTLGTVVDTPIRGLRVSGNYSTNAKINFDTTRDIYNESLPSGKGVSKDIGLKFDLFDRRISGNLNYYVSEGRNFIATLGNRDDIDPDGINGRNGGPGYLYSKTSDGYNVTLTSRPLKGWEVRLNVATADGRERSDVTLPQFYNDQFNTTTVNGQTVVGVKATAGATVTPLLVRSNPLDATSAQIPLTLDMLKDPNSLYYARLDAEAGYITSQTVLSSMKNTPGVGTGVTGLPTTQNQLGFVSPSGGTFIARRAGEKTTGYAERSYSIINRYQFTEGRLRGLVVGVSTSYQQNYRAYMYNDMLDGNKRKMFYFPNRFLNDVYFVYRFTPLRRVRASVQINVANALDANQVLYLRSSTNGSFRYAQWFNAPRKLSLTTSLTF